jgi:hypothetical protein
MKTIKKAQKGITAPKKTPPPAPSKKFERPADSQPSKEFYPTSGVGTNTIAKMVSGCRKLQLLLRSVALLVNVHQSLNLVVLAKLKLLLKHSRRLLNLIRRNNHGKDY